MAFSFFPKQKFFALSLISIAIFCCCSGHAQDYPGHTVAAALLCFNNQLFYSDCDEAYRLNPSGNINVPPGAVDLFCNGPCLADTQRVLNCIDKVFSNFVFYNKATLPEVRYALNAGCSYTDQRGNFNLGDYLGGLTSGAHRWSNSKSFHAILLISVFCLFLRLV